MTLNASGPISLGGATAGQSINIELGQSGTATVSLNDANVRSLAGVPSGAIIMPTNFYGKSDVANLSYVFSANTNETTITISTLPGYKAGKTNLTVTINASVLIVSTTTATPALTITGGTAGDTVVVVNNGFIAGRGGAGGAGTGGVAVSLGYPATINNTSPAAYIGGGGGGGGTASNGGGGGGAGNGPAPATGSGGGNGGTTFPGTGGAGGSAPFGGTASGAPGGSGGGGGGYSRAGSGHNPICNYTVPPLDQGGGGGGGWGASGGSGGPASRSGAPGGSGSAAGGNAGPSPAGGAGGKAVALNGNTVTWTSGDTTRVYGSVS
jgi:hypothetical protein